MGFNEGMKSRQQETSLFGFQRMHGHHVNRNEDCLGFNEGMAVLSAGNNNCLGSKEGMKILTTGTTIV